jgi:hypothetical protein
LRVIAKVTVQRAAEAEIDLPDFQTFWQGGVLRIDPDKVPPRTFTLHLARSMPPAITIAVRSKYLLKCKIKERATLSFSERVTVFFQKDT